MNALAKLALYLVALAVVLGASFALGRAVRSDEDPVPPTTVDAPVTEPAPVSEPAPAPEPTTPSGTHDLHEHP